MNILSIHNFFSVLNTLSVKQKKLLPDQQQSKSIIQPLFFRIYKISKIFIILTANIIHI